jgi:hypothetical protein
MAHSTGLFKVISYFKGDSHNWTKVHATEDCHFWLVSKYKKLKKMGKNVESISSKMFHWHLMKAHAPNEIDNTIVYEIIDY